MIVPSANRKKRSGGNALAEMALVMLPTMALISMFCDLCYATFSWSTIQHAAREGCRYAITFQTNLVAGGQDANIMADVQNNSMALVTATPIPPAPQMIFVDYIDGNPLSPTYLQVVPFANGGNIPGNIVRVSIQGYPVQWLVPLTGTIAQPFLSQTPATISAYSADVLGAFPPGVSSVPR